MKNKSFVLLNLTWIDLFIEREILTGGFLSGRVFVLLKIGKFLSGGVLSEGFVLLSG